MCLAVPCKVIEIEGRHALVEGAGHRRQVETLLLKNKDVRVGDYLLVHEELAITILPTDEALRILKMIESLSELPGVH
ncbi:MAG: HypC/HybG/HupF family hydrogenase formation chaperone [Proteobacteria bacterium]|nr:HypC/HybG/HupF family hydrogenase formation chaperone [Pseudomonadota bacterium]